MDYNLIFTAVGFLITGIGAYWKLVLTINSNNEKLRMEFALLKQQVESNKASTDESINRLIKSLDKLELSIEKLTDKINDK